MAGPARLGRTRLVAVDGPSGAGKTVFAARLAEAVTAEAGAAEAVTADAGAAEALPADAAAADVPAGRAADAGGGRPPVVHTDDLLDGWDDQLTFWSRLEDGVLAPVRAGRSGAYRRYSWMRRRFLPTPVPVPAAPVLIVEGVSAARAAAGPVLTLAVFVTAPRSLRLTRAVARDGPAILPELRRWHAVERAHFAADGTAGRADLVVDGAPALPHDPDRYYLRITAGGAADADR
nr:hypothetical protein [Micromonospora tarapacensis]